MVQEVVVHEEDDEDAFDKCVDSTGCLSIIIISILLMFVAVVVIVIVCCKKQDKGGPGYPGRNP